MIIMTAVAVLPGDAAGALTALCAQDADLAVTIAKAHYPNPKAENTPRVVKALQLQRKFEADIMIAAVAIPKHAAEALARISNWNEFIEG